VPELWPVPTLGTQRFDGKKIRLRMILEEDGLESLVGSPWRPDLTPDRLGALLSLLGSCGVVHKSERGYTVSNGSVGGPRHALTAE
jgi:hypothetical protein